jgi:hypothetical protein
MKSEPPPLFPIFYDHRMNNNRNSHCALSEEEGGIVSSYLYRGTVAAGIVRSACPSLLMHSSDERADVTMPVAMDNAITTNQCPLLLWSKTRRY